MSVQKECKDYKEYAHHFVKVMLAFYCLLQSISCVKEVRYLSVRIVLGTFS